MQIHNTEGSANVSNLIRMGTWFASDTSSNVTATSLTSPINSSDHVSDANNQEDQNTSSNGTATRSTSLEVSEDVSSSNDASTFMNTPQVYEDNTAQTQIRNISDNYRVIKQLGSGAMASVFLVENKETKQIAALKSIRKVDPQEHWNPLLYPRTAFINEQKMLKELGEHKNIISLYEALIRKPSKNM